YSLPTQKELRCKREKQGELKPPLNDVDIVFVPGGTCRIPFVLERIIEMFPKAETIMDRELEIITATGATIHALQVLNGEVEPYVKIIEQGNNISDSITKELNRNMDDQNITSNEDLDFNEQTT